MPHSPSTMGRPGTAARTSSQRSRVELMPAGVRRVAVIGAVVQPGVDGQGCQDRVHVGQRDEPVGIGLADRGEAGAQPERQAVVEGVDHGCPGGGLRRAQVAHRVTVVVLHPGAGIAQELTVGADDVDVGVRLLVVQAGGTDFWPSSEARYSGISSRVMRSPRRPTMLGSWRGAPRRSGRSRGRGRRCAARS